MDVATVRRERMRSQRLSAPAATVDAAAAHMLATQSQDFRGGRWALGVRTAGAPTVHDVDAAFDAGHIVRSWTMRGTIHIIPGADLAWVLSITGERQLRQAATVRRREGIDDEELERAERVVRATLSGGGRLTRGDLLSALVASRVPTDGQRGYHLLVSLSLRGVLCQGPVVARENDATREQYFVLTEDWIQDASAPADPLGELYARYIASHGPAQPRDFAWWSGLPLGVARDAAERVRASGLIDEVEVESPPDRHGRPIPAHAWHVSRERPHTRGPTSEVVALPPFDEYYLSYADRSIACSPDRLDAVGPSRNGMVRPVIVERGEVIGVWTHSIATGRHADGPVPALFAHGTTSPRDIAKALERYRAFIAG